MTKKIFSLLACTTLIAIFTACSSIADNTPSDSGSGTTDSQKTEITSDTTKEVEASTSGVTTRVLWTISNYVLGKDFTGSENAAKELLFKPLDINDTQIIFDGQVCDHVTFEKNMVNSSDYLTSNWEETPQSLGIEFEDLQVIKTNCKLLGFQEYMRLGNGQLVVPYNGVFFFFQPTVN
ncbi:MAG: hypothetical protein ACYC59_06620 [Anaerolineaceae bacterium]